MKNIIACFLMALFAAISQGAFAHTTIADQGTAGINLYTNISIPHGCGHLTKPGIIKEVKAMSVVFPNSTDSIATVAGTGEPVLMNTVITGAIGGRGVFSVSFIQDKDVFETTEVIVDAAGNKHGIHYMNGFLDTLLTGFLPFRATLPAFIPGSCAKKITARVGIANYCTGGTGVVRSDVWIGKLTPLFNDPAVVSVGFWPALVINRDLVKSPLDASCGEGFDVILEPSSDDIDAILPIPGFNP